MNPIAQLFLATAGLSALLSYAWWLYHRVWALRRDLFQIRDNLWARMFELDLLDDPSHRTFRDGINSVIRIAPMLSLFTVFRLTVEHEEMQRIAGVPESFPNEVMSPYVEESRRLMFVRLVRYLVMETITGLAFLAALQCVFMARAYRRYLIRKIAQLFDLHIFERFDRAITPVMHDLAKMAKA